MVAAADDGEIQRNKIAKTRKLKSSEPQTNYQITFAKAGENLSLLKLEQTNHSTTGEIPKSQELNHEPFAGKSHKL